MTTAVQVWILVLVGAIAPNLGATESAFPPPIGETSIVPAGAQLERIFDGGCVLTEGVAAGHDGAIYFSDITFTRLCSDASGRYLQAGNIWKYDPATGKATIFRSPSGMSNGLKFDAAGNMIAALGADYGGRMLIRTDMNSGRSLILTGLYDGKPYNAPNDVSIDEQGRIYFSDPRYLGHEPVFQAGFAVYRLDPDGAVTRLITDAGKPNGVLVSPDQHTLYVVSNDNGWLDFLRLEQGEQTHQGTHVVWAYDLAADGSVSNRRVFKDYSKVRTPACSGPDGLIADAAGNVYAAERCEHRPGIAVYNPHGEELAFISTGTELPTNVGFGRGNDANVLYVTSGRSVYRIELGQAGYQLPSQR